MARNSYVGIARLCTHPAWDSRRLALVCPVCDGEHTRVREYDADFLGHDPQARLAWINLSWRTYERQAAKRGWPVGDEAFALFGTTNEED